MSREIAKADLVVVGAGIVGLAHAYDARRRGLDVVVVDRDERAVGASIRNFGHCFLSATAAGAVLETATEARRRWLELGRAAGFTVTQGGSLVVARHEDELAVLESLSRDPARGARVVSTAEVAKLAPVSTDRVLGGLHAALDLRVDPREAIAAVAAHLRAEGVVFVWNAAVAEVTSDELRTSQGVVRAERVVVCPGPDLQTLFPDVFAQRDGLTRVKLQMLTVRPPDGRVYRPALLTGLSLLRYPGFTALPEVDAVRQRLEREAPELVAHGIHLIITQRANGELIIGDTHEYATTVSPFGDERLDALVLGEAAQILDVSALEVLSRWHGVYPTAPGDPFLVAAPADGVRVVSVVSGIGMTTALGLAPRVLDDLL
jgi:FAD dependent oxidoreductase TIGR03364